MDPLTDRQIRTSFVNATRRESTQATLPALTALDWERLDYLGWRDPKLPGAAYAVLPLPDGPVGLLLRPVTPSPEQLRRKVLCAWCQDLSSALATSFVARRAGASGRNGNTIGTLVCEDFSCSANVRRPPVASELGTTVDAETFVAGRVAGLRERSARFAAQVLSTR